MKQKVIFSITLAIFLILVLAACGGESSPTSPPANPPSENSLEEPVEVPAEENSSSPEEQAPEPAATEEELADEARISFSADVLPILESRCLNCHGGDRVEGDFVVRTYADLFAGGESGPVVIPGDAGASYLAELLLEEKMPKRGPKLTPVQTDTIIEWINQGAENN